MSASGLLDALRFRMHPLSEVKRKLRPKADVFTVTDVYPFARRAIEPPIEAPRL